MSNKVIDINKYRNKRDHAWLRKHEARISDVIRYYLANNFVLDFEYLAEAYQDQKRDGFDQSWDYLDLRELIAEVLEKSEVIDLILDDLKSKHWFNEKLISKQKILEICLSIFVLETNIYA